MMSTAVVGRANYLSRASGQRVPDRQFSLRSRQDPEEPRVCAGFELSPSGTVQRLLRGGAAGFVPVATDL